MKKITTAKGENILVDECDFNWLLNYSWHVRKCAGYFYATTKSSRPKHKTIYMHRLILDAKKGEYVDHIDGNGLNNTRSNIRICTNKQNSFNQKARGRTSKFKGVSFCSRTKKWIVTMKLEDRTRFFGRFDKEIDAAKKYNEVAAKYHGEFAKLNGGI